MCGDSRTTPEEVPVSRRVRWALRDDAGFALDVGVSLSHPAGRAVHARMSRSEQLGRFGHRRAVPGALYRVLGSTSTFTINGTTVTYMRDCPCFDAQGKNYGTPTELPAIAQAANGVTSYDVSAWSCRFINSGSGGCIPDARRARRDAFFRNAFFRNAFFRNVAHSFESDRRAQPDSRHRRCDVGVRRRASRATIDLGAAGDVRSNVGFQLLVS